MNDSTEYAKMIELNIPSCEYVNKRKSRFLKKKTLARKVNDQLSLLEKEEECDQNCSYCDQNDKNCNKVSEKASNMPVLYDEKVAKAEKRKTAVIYAQVAACFALVAAIILTNVFWENSGMNTLLKSVFQSEQIAEQDNRTHVDFSLFMPATGEGVTLSSGVITVMGEYSLYPVCEGVVEKVDKNADGTYTVTVEHSDNFSSIIEGINFVYFGQGESVNPNVPIGYTKNKASVYLYNNGSLITDYAAVENSIVFNK
ncbi:MAG: hypothetical protein IJW13_05110 [Clostridia bacterium]|nr:hypothetical protein [Clostridia bacterium]